MGPPEATTPDSGAASNAEEAPKSKKKSKVLFSSLSALIHNAESPLLIVRKNTNISRHTGLKVMHLTKSANQR